MNTSGIEIGGRVEVSPHYRIIAIPDGDRITGTVTRITRIGAVYVNLDNLKTKSGKGRNFPFDRERGDVITPIS
jgi:hypothetical protein